MVNFIFTFLNRVKDVVTLDGIVKDTGLGDFLALETFILLQVFSVVVAKMVVRDN